MGTSAIVRVEGIGYVEMYKNWDGYPDGMLPWLEKFNADFAANRGNDPQYKFAQLLRYTANPDVIRTFNLDSSLYTGYGVNQYGEGYYNYLYTLKVDGSVTVEE